MNLLQKNSFAVAACAVFLAPSVGHAQDSSASDDEASEGKIVLDSPGYGPPEKRTDYRHEGFYLRLNMGSGMVGGAFEDYGFFSGSLSIDALVGGMPSPGTAIGGGFFTDTVLSTKVKLDGDPLDERRLVSIGLLGPFVDGFPDANDGFHLGAALGVSANSIQDLSDGSLLGFGGVVWVGYDAWTSPDFSVGVNLRGMVTRTYGDVQSASGDDTNESLNGATGSLVLMFTALYN